MANFRLVKEEFIVKILNLGVWLPSTVEGVSFCGNSVVSQQFMEPEVSLTSSQDHSTCTYPGTDQSSLNHPGLFLQDRP
jgi:hypothetical protein